jgi:NADPH-dependent 2,4-dienoyl-CoA reductase/sulfur reductase-like enzyme/peroxiredoxin family protein/rhodanese-related sulfurtransferase/TusA-related sulfurtransferase
MTQALRIVIVGGVAGGASAATRARRLSEQAEIVLLERGEHISFANCGMPYHIGGAIAERDRLLVQTPAALRKRYRIDVRTRSEVLSIDRGKKEVLVRDLAAGREYSQPYDKLILAPGAEPVRPAFDGANLPGVLTLRSLSDMDAIKKLIDEGKPSRAVVVGGGYIGLEMAEALRQRQVGVTLVELAGQVFAAVDPEMATPIHQHLRQHGVDLRLGVSVTAIAGAAGALEVRLSTGEVLPAGLVILAVGVRPESALARKAGLDIGPTGGIVTDAHMRTSDGDIYAVGDAVEVTELVAELKAVIPLAGPANRQGRIAADNCMGRPSVYKRTQGTAIVKVFDLAVGLTGPNEKTLARAQRRFEKVYVHPASHAGYYPGASPISLKVLFDPTTGRVLGGQAVGARGVDKRIDVLAVAIRAGMTVFDLEELELSYAPPYGSAKDVINYAGFVAANAIRGDVRLCHTGDLAAASAGQLLLDVRTPAEVQAGTIPGAINVPLDELRGRLGELPREKELLVFCQVGLRGYLACRILQQHGYSCRNLSGGYKTYAAAIEATAQPLPAAPPPAEMRSDAGDDAPPPEARKQRPFEPTSSAVQVDARGLACPGPIMRLKQAVDALGDGGSVTLLASDPAFGTDVKAWCSSTGNQLLEVKTDGGAVAATVRKVASPASEARPAAAAQEALMKHKTIIVFSDAFDRAMASFILANGAAAAGSDVTLFFTFWGINVLRRDSAVAVPKTLIERMFGWMMPRGARRLSLSKMNMGGMGTRMIRGIMKAKNVPSLPELIASAQAAGVKLVACTMTMDLMGIKPAELIDGVQYGGVATYLQQAEQGNVNLFI